MVINAVGPVILEPWIDHPNVTAVVWAGIGGMEVGNALVDVMYGAQTPSGHSYHIRSQLSNLGGGSWTVSVEHVTPQKRNYPSSLVPLSENHQNFVLSRIKRSWNI